MKNDVRQQWKDCHGDPGQDRLCQNIAEVIIYLGDSSILNKQTNLLEHSQLYWTDGDGHSPSIDMFNITSVENMIKQNVLPFLRTASLLKYHLYNKNLPAIAEDVEEFGSLAEYLCLGSLTDKTSDCLKWMSLYHEPTLMDPALRCTVSKPQELVKTWCMDYLMFVSRGLCAARSLLVDQHITWQPPKLLKLPKVYNTIFQVSKY